MFHGNFSLYRNTPETAGWYRHEVGKVSYREAMTNPAAMQFDEWAGIYYIVEDLAATAWHEDVIFDISFRRYRTRAEAPEGCGPRRYAWEAGEVCEYRLEQGRPVRRTALLIHLQKRVMRAPAPDVLAAQRYWILPNGFGVQDRLTPWSVRAARIPHGHELLAFCVRRPATVTPALRKPAGRLPPGQRPCRSSCGACPVMDTNEVANKTAAASVR